MPLDINKQNGPLWTVIARASFDACPTNARRYSTRLSISWSNGLSTDAVINIAVGVIVYNRTTAAVSGGRWIFFFKLSTAEQRYITCDIKLLAAYLQGARHYEWITRRSTTICLYSIRQNKRSPSTKLTICSSSVSSLITQQQVHCRCRWRAPLRTARGVLYSDYSTCE